MEKIYIITENYRNEKCGDSTEEIRVVSAHHTREEAKAELEEIFKEVLENAEKMFGKDYLCIEEVSEYGAQVYLDCEWDTFHADYSIIETTLE